MVLRQQLLTRAFTDFFESERSAGILLLLCTVTALVLANSALGPAWLSLWQHEIGGLTLQHWINDALMALFFLLIGLELERELYAGELAQPRAALLPILAAVGGMLVPALLYLAWNAELPTRAGFGIPMATDIAFALGVLSLLGQRVPAALKVFVVAFAVIDDLGAIVIIAAFYTNQLSLGHLLGALLVLAVLVALNRPWRVMSLTPYLLGGVVLWFLLLRAGVHPTLAGVVLAFAIPFTARGAAEASPSARLEKRLNRPVAFLVLPAFALANTGVVIGPDWLHDLASPHGIGIAAGLLLGKPVGILLLVLAAVWSGLCRLPAGLNWWHIGGAGLLGGIGFTMSIFITRLAFAGDAATMDTSIMAILAASALAGTAGCLWLYVVGNKSLRQAS